MTLLQERGLLASHGKEFKYEPHQRTKEVFCEEIHSTGRVEASLRDETARLPYGCVFLLVSLLNKGHKGEEYSY